MAQDKKYLLKAGAVICNPLFHGGAIYTNANLTDEIAAEYLTKYPDRAVLFSKYDKAAGNKAPKVEASAKKAAKTATKKESAKGEATNEE